MTHEFPICIVCKDECTPDHDPAICLSEYAAQLDHVKEMDARTRYVSRTPDDLDCQA